MCWWRIGATVALIAILLVAVAVARSAGMRGSAAAPAVSGGAAATGRRDAAARRAASLGRQVTCPPDADQFGVGAQGPLGGAPESLDGALARHAAGLDLSDAVGVHSLDGDRYGGGAAGGGAAGGAYPDRPWTEFESWAKLSRNPAAKAQYMAQRAAVIDNPDVDWGPVVRELAPRLAEDREFIGIVNIDPAGDGKALRIVEFEASPTVGFQTTPGGGLAASVPPELVQKYMNRPALFIFHTHPAKSLRCPMLSSDDILLSTYTAALSRFAASAVVSLYGVHVTGLSWSGYKAIWSSKFPIQALRNMCHDVVSAHGAIRSWAPFTTREYLDFYPRYQQWIVSYPSAEMAADRKKLFSRPLESGDDNLSALKNIDTIRHIFTLS
jgi:hypothetical protein